MDAKHKDGKTLVDIDELEQWEQNPRTADENELERLKSHIRSLDLYKPLVVTSDGTVVGGNMRLQALQALNDDPDEADHGEVWVSVIEPEDEDELLEYALSDNDRIGHYDEGQLGDLLRKYEIDVARFKVDFYKPQDLAQNMASAMDPEELIAKETGGTVPGTSGSDDDAGDSTGDGDGSAAEAAADAAGDAAGAAGDATESGGEADDAGDVSDEADASDGKQVGDLGQRTTTAMVQLIMTSTQKDTFGQQVSDLKREYGVDTTSDVVREAVRRAHNELLDTSAATDTASDDAEETDTDAADEAVENAGDDAAEADD